MRASHNGAFSIHQNWPANPLALCAIGGRMDFSGLPAQQLRALFFRLADAFKAARPSGLSIRRLPRRCAFNHLNNYSPAEWSCRSAIIIPAERRGRHFESLVKSEEARAAPNCQYNLNNAAVARGKFQLPGRRGVIFHYRASREIARVINFRGAALDSKLEKSSARPGVIIRPGQGDSSAVRVHKESRNLKSCGLNLVAAQKAARFPPSPGGPGFRNCFCRAALSGSRQYLSKCRLRGGGGIFKMRNT